MTNATVGISDMKILKNEGTLITYALGSCIGICVYDETNKLGGMVHIMLPRSLRKPGDNIYKYADSGIQDMIKQLELKGASRNRMIAKIAGGAKMFELQESSVLGNIGDRNAQSALSVLSSLGIPVKSKDIGLNYARTMSFDVGTGKVVVKTFGKPEKIL